MILKTEQINPHPRRRHLLSAEEHHVTKKCVLALVVVIGYMHLAHILWLESFISTIYTVLKKDQRYFMA